MTLPIQTLDENEKFILAAAINLYIQARRRIDGRVLLSGQDIDPLFGICEELITKRPWSAIQTPMTREEALTAEEEEAVQKVGEEVAQRMDRR